MEIGLFGGTFDPVHKAHLQCANAALAETAVESIIFIPAASPPHKNDDAICSFEHRMRMLRIAVEKYPQFSVSDLEGRRAYPSYTIDTLDAFCRQNKTNRYHFVIGCDAFLEIETWYQWQRIISFLDFIVVIRPGYHEDHLQQLLQRLNFIRESSSVWFNRHANNKIRMLLTETDDISSSDIRKKIRTKGAWSLFVPEEIEAYIRKNGLYQ